jgi:hypothetical protein
MAARLSTAEAQLSPATVATIPVRTSHLRAGKAEQPHRLRRGHSRCAIDTILAPCSIGAGRSGSGTAIAAEVQTEAPWLLSSS